MLQDGCRAPYRWHSRPLGFFLLGKAVWPDSCCNTADGPREEGVVGLLEQRKPVCQVERIVMEVFVEARVDIENGPELAKNLNRTADGAGAVNIKGQSEEMIHMQARRSENIARPELDLVHLLGKCFSIEMFFVIFWKARLPCPIGPRHSDAVVVLAAWLFAAAGL